MTFVVVDVMNKLLKLLLQVLVKLNALIKTIFP